MSFRKEWTDRRSCTVYAMKDMTPFFSPETEMIF